MKKNNLKRFLASLLAVLMLSQVTGVAPSVFADVLSNDTQTEETQYEAPQLRSGTAVIPAGSDVLTVNKLLAQALIANYDKCDPATRDNLEWEYECEGTWALSKNTAWGSIAGFKSETGKYIKTTYTHPALAANEDGDYQVRIKGSTNAVTLTKAAKLSSAITVVNTVPEIVVPYNTDGSVNTAKLNESIFNAVVTGTTPELTYNDLTYKYTASGEQTVIISFAGNEDYFPTTAQATVKFVDNRATAFELKEKPDTLSIGYKGSLPDLEATLAKVREQLVNKVGNVALDQIKVECKVLGKYKIPNIADVLAHMAVATDIKLTYAGDATYKSFSVIVEDIKFADNRVESTIVFKGNATITYNMDASVQKEAIIKNAIDYEQSKLPEGTGVDDFTVKINGREIPDAKLDAGENQTISISYNGNSDFKPCNEKGAINVEKANVKVSMKRFTTVYAGQDIDKDVLKVALDPNDPAIDVYIVFAGINTKFDTSVNLVLTKQQWAVIENISKFQQFIFDNDKTGLFKDKTTLQQKLEKGMTIGEFKAYMLDFIDALEKASEIPGVDDLMKKYGISIDSLKAMATIFDKLTAFSDDTQIALGSPKHAGLYTAFALAVNKNYNTGVANGIVRIAMNTAGMKLVPNADIKGKNIDAETAKQMRETGTPALVTLYCGDSAENVDQSSIHYWFTGVNTIYAGSKMPTKPGKYIVTASVYGGDYLAPPVTFTFRITK